MTVTERPEDFHVEIPTGDFINLEPFSPWEKNQENAQKSPLIILNTPLERIDLRALWASSSVQVCADGGANRLYEYFKEESEREKYIPTFLTGDFDSLRDEVKLYYKEKGTVVITQYCQYSSDFMKAIKVVVLYGSQAGKKALYEEVGEVDGLNPLVDLHIDKCAQLHQTVVKVNMAGGIGGRFDQTFQLINQMYAMKEEYPWVHLVFFASQDVIFMVPRGVTYVTYSDRRIFNTKEKIPKCGLLPFGKKTVLKSTGLLYDVDDWPSEIGAHVSSSNGVCGTTGFIVESTENIVMNVEVSRDFA